MNSPCEDCRRNCEEPCWKVEHGLLVEKGATMNWISVKDGLPERPPADEWGEFAREWYKVKFEDGFVKDWLFEFNHDSEIPYGFWNDKKHGSVTHWAEIEPPKEEA